MKLQIARIGKPHGIRGEVTVQLFTDVPEDRFGAGAVLMAEPASKGPLTVSSARWNKQILVLGFEEVTTRNGAEELRGTQLFIDADEPENDEEGWYSHDLEGLKAMVDGRQVGTVSELVTGTAQDLLVISVPGGPDDALFSMAFDGERDLWLGAMGQLRHYRWHGQRLRLLKCVKADDGLAKITGVAVAIAGGVNELKVVLCCDVDKIE